MTQSIPDTPEMDALTIEESKAMRDRFINVLAVPGTDITNTDAAILALSELLVQTSLLVTAGNRATARDLIGGLVDSLLDIFTTDESLQRMKEAQERWPTPSIEKLRSMGLVP
jgi:hypothetical protein